MIPVQIGDVVGDYRVIDIAGSGGMGAVYKIEHLITKRIEAMKLLPPGLSSDPEQVRRFEREIQVQARLHHPNIVALYNAVRDGKSIALVMEFVEGESLQRMVEAGPLPVERAVDFTCQVLGALAYAHDAGVIHRDVAPANIIITPEHVAKLTDFGLARGATDLRLSTSGVPLGSPWYMSPEQVRGIGALDARTDLYAMGAVLHEMLTGGKLFEVEGAFAVMRAHVETEPAPPSARNPKVPAVLDDIVRKAVAKDPAMRFQSADEFRLALENVAGGVRPVVVASSPEETQATLPPLPSRLWELHPSRAAMLMMLVSAALLAGFYTMRLFTAARVQATGSKPRATVTSQHDAALPLPAVAARVEPEPSGAVPSPPPEVPAETAKPAARARPGRQFRVPPMRQASKPEQSYAIRVTGGEPQPPEAMPAPSRSPRRPVEAPEPLVSTVDSVEIPEADARPSASDVPELATTSQEAAPAKPQNSGNRFVRALGKLNPFRKGTKYDSGEAAKTPLRKD